MLPALTVRERGELFAEAERLRALGRLDARTAPRLGMIALGLGLPALRPSALTMYAAADCIPLLAGSMVEPLVQAALGAEADGAIWAALRSLAPAAPAPEPAPAPERPPELLPDGFTIDGESLLDNARRTAGAVKSHASVERRPLFAAAIEAHRAGRLAEWMAGEPRARVG